MHDATNRRTVLKATGASLAAVTLAGCGSSDNGNGDGSGGDDNTGGGDEYEIEPGTEIMFAGLTSHWEGNAPPEIEGTQNPTLVLTEGETYTIGWDEGNGAGHNIELRDDSGSVVDGLETDLAMEPGDDQILEFEATSEITTYRCQPHSGMEGSIVVE
ncbi:Copper binding protein, plastocyanin/azurin family, protein exported by TAT pathway [Halovivax ruber XH-70]|uniref:Copper binding protein, plastocyanin/azurin family, protein exported by TAT pathway n=1 Tax=Halovivax ruber (strain DSM 18193 / JCM 13892 / XH-70) TaxID=797302 RepID=L0I6J5_HALRX|nr:plastocyanin/azurin family copper-binding protein [Halovivax ruber]AGB15170.1 Copper binding protein, plastocyanin/azurin family, protein exported by TAT pathway [Halovivax ruber XH-70]